MANISYLSDLSGCPKFAKFVVGVPVPSAKVPVPSPAGPVPGLGVTLFDLRLCLSTYLFIARRRGTATVVENTLRHDAH